MAPLSIRDFRKEAWVESQNNHLRRACQLELGKHLYLCTETPITSFTFTHFHSTRKEPGYKASTPHAYACYISVIIIMLQCTLVTKHLPGSHTTHWLTGIATPTGSCPRYRQFWRSHEKNWLAWGLGTLVLALNTQTCAYTRGSHLGSVSEHRVKWSQSTSQELIKGPTWTSMTKINKVLNRRG